MVNENDTMNESDKLTPQEISSMETPFSEFNALMVTQQPTPGDWISILKQRGQSFSYVSGDVVIRMLNKAFRNRWSFEVVETREFQAQNKLDKKTGEVTPQGTIIEVLGRMTVPGWGVREQWGAQILNGGSDVQEHAFKSATTDAMKKCASMFGVALDLYGTEGATDLLITPQDFLRNDTITIEKMKEKMKERESENRPTAEPNELELNQREEETEEETVESHSPTSQEPEPTQINTIRKTEEPPVVAPQEQFIDPATLQNETVVPPESVQETMNPEPTTATPSTENTIGGWKAEDIQDMKNLKTTLGLDTNEGLNPYVQEFMRLDDATVQKHITPSNARDFIIFVTKNHLQ